MNVVNGEYTSLWALGEQLRQGGVNVDIFWLWPALFGW